MADVDTGGGNAVNAAWITERPHRDGRGGHEHRGPGLPQALRPHGRQGGHRRRGDGRQDPGLRRRARPTSTPAFIINARTDAFSVHGLDEAIRRCNLYLDAGADLAFIDGIRTKADDRAGGRPRCEGPLSVNLMDAISRHEDRARAHPRAGEAGGGPRLDPGGLDHGRAQGAPVTSSTPSRLAHRHPGGRRPSG